MYVYVGKWEKSVGGAVVSDSSCWRLNKVDEQVGSGKASITFSRRRSEGKCMLKGFASEFCRVRKRMREERTERRYSEERGL